MIYCHSHLGNKREGDSLFKYFMEYFSICLFDFPGLGNGSEKYCSMGY